MQLEKVFHITVYTPPEQAEIILQAIMKVAPLNYGKYQQVAWISAQGSEQFQPVSGSNPAMGKPGKTTRHPSVKIDFTIPRDPQLLDQVITEGIYPHHPWEEPVIIIRKSQAARKFS